MSIILFSVAQDDAQEVIYTSSSPFKVSRTSATVGNSELGMYNSMKFTVYYLI